MDCICLRGFSRYCNEKLFSRLKVGLVMNHPKLAELNCLKEVGISLRPHGIHDFDSSFNQYSLVFRVSKFLL